MLKMFRKISMSVKAIASRDANNNLIIRPGDTGIMLSNAPGSGGLISEAFNGNFIFSFDSSVIAQYGGFCAVTITNDLGDKLATLVEQAWYVTYGALIARAIVHYSYIGFSGPATMTYTVSRSGNRVTGKLFRNGTLLKSDYFDVPAGNNILKVGAYYVKDSANDSVSISNIRNSA